MGSNIISKYLDMAVINNLWVLTNIVQGERYQFYPLTQFRYFAKANLRLSRNTLCFSTVWNGFAIPLALCFFFTPFRRKQKVQGERFELSKD